VFAHRTYKSTKKPLYISSETSSRRDVILRARDSRRYSGATVSAVTWPCHSLLFPSAFPRTRGRNRLNGHSGGYQQRDFTHHNPSSVHLVPLARNIGRATEQDSSDRSRCHTIEINEPPKTLVARRKKYDLRFPSICPSCCKNKVFQAFQEQCWQNTDMLLNLNISEALNGRRTLIMVTRIDTYRVSLVGEQLLPVVRGENRR